MKLTKEWITGFVDGLPPWGTGCFSIKKNSKNPGKLQHLNHVFYVSQDEKSVDVLYALKKEFGCGTVHRGGDNMYNYVISKQEHVRDICIPHFIRYPLQTRKKYVFHRWAESFQEYMKKQGKESGTALPLVCTLYQVSAGWFRGFVDAEGCFSVSRDQNRFQPRFFIGAHQDSALIHQCQKLINCGAVHHRKDGMDMLQVSAIKDLEEKLFPFFETRGSAVLLRTIKRISFQKFRRIVRFVQLGRASTLEERKRIEKLRTTMNQQNKIGQYVFPGVAEHEKV